MSVTLLCAALAMSASPSQFDLAMERMFTQSESPGALTAAYQGGKMIFAKAYGQADIEKKIPMKTDMAFEIGSVSKQFTAFALLMLVNEKKLRLDEKLGDILPDLPESWRTATVEQTLHHMSGIPDYEEIAGYDFYNSARKPKEIIASANSKPLEFPHGEKHLYSNTGYFLLCLVLEKRSGMPSGKFFETRIFKPLGMTRTFAQTRPRNSLMARGYHSRSGERKAQPPIAWSSTLGAGGIVTTLEDFGKWDAALYGEKLLPAHLRDLMWNTTQTNSGEKVNYALGWFIGASRGVPSQGHAGQTNGFTCGYDRFPSLRYSTFTVTNTYGGRMFGMHQLTTAHFSKDLSHLSRPIPADPDAAKTDRSLKAIKQAVLGGEDLALLGQGMKDFATKSEFKAKRDEMRPMMETTKSFQFLRFRPRKSTDGQDIEEFLYRVDYSDGTAFIAVMFMDGLLVSLTWELE